MSAKVFLDTNTLVYLLEGSQSAETATPAQLDANRKADLLLAIIEQDALVIAVQVMNELCNVVLRRKFSWPALQELLASLEELCVEIVPLSLEVHKLGLYLRQKYQLQLYDAMLLAAPLQAGCSIFYSEDMQDGQVIEKSLTIKNPFGE